jgi:hypothetical protein
MEDTPMFIIQPANPAEWQSAMFMLSYYHVYIELYSDGENQESTYMVVSTPGTDGEQERLAEMCFQMNWHQKGNLCPHCTKQDTDGTSDDDVSDDVCGHLTFDKLIKPAF